MTSRLSLLGVGLGLILIIIAGLWWSQARRSTPSSQPSASIVPTVEVSPTSSTSPGITYKTIKASDIAAVPSQFNYRAEVPSSWQVEIVKEAETINIYDPAASGDSNLDKSQIFIRYFKANDFLTLNTVDILSRESLTIAGRPAIRYVIQKKTSVPNFANQPEWRNEKHTVTDIRVSDTNPSLFYVVAKRPDLQDEIYQHFFDSIKLNSTTSLVEPVQEFKSRITKKMFGTYVTPQNSPVQPEKFTGYHTGVDVEFTDISTDVSVKAIASGTVVTSRTARGYGGIVVIKHPIAGKDILTIYGHLDPKSLVKEDASVQIGEQIGILGEGGTSETDGERKHLHFAMLKGTSVDLKGYVANKSELDNWYNPLDFF